MGPCDRKAAGSEITNLKPMDFWNLCAAGSDREPEVCGLMPRSAPLVNGTFGGSVQSNWGAAGSEILSLQPMGAGPGSSRRLSCEACGSELGSSSQGNRKPEAYRVSGPGTK